jgi:hypothetical protein
MRLLLVFALCAGVANAGQEPAAPPSTPTEKSTTQQPAAAPAEKQSIVVPARTLIPVKLTDSVWSKTARPGDQVHAVTILPVSVGYLVAIPAGTYVNGVVDHVWKRASSTHPAIEMHFTEMVFSTGYTVPLETATTEVQERVPDGAPGSVAAGQQYEAYAFPPPILSGAANSAPAQFPPPPQQPPPLPQPSHPNMGVIIGASLGATAALVLTTIYLENRPMRGGYTMLDAGSQIDLMLASPLELDGGEVAGAVQ